MSSTLIKTNVPKFWWDKMEPMNDPEWPVIESVTEYETGWYRGGYDLVEQPDGSTKRYYWAALPPAVVVVPRLEDEVIFVEQYRPTVRERQLELPAGIVESGEDPVEAANRELQEEAGYRAGGLEILQELWVATGVLRHKRTVVFASGLEPVNRDLDENEFLTVTTYPIEEAVKRGREAPTNEATVDGLLLAAAEGRLEGT